MTHGTDQHAQQPTPTAAAEDTLLNAWVASVDDVYAEMARTRVNAAARCTRSNCGHRAVSA